MQRDSGCLFSISRLLSSSWPPVVARLRFWKKRRERPIIVNKNNKVIIEGQVRVRMWVWVCVCVCEYNLPFSPALPLHLNHSHHLWESRRHSCFSGFGKSLSKLSNLNKRYNKSVYYKCVFMSVYIMTLGILWRFGQGLGLIHITADWNNQVFIWKRDKRVHWHSVCALSGTKFLVLSTHHRPRRRHWLEQTAHREEEGGGGQSLFVSGFAQTAWTDTAAPEVMPENGKQITVFSAL